MATISEGYLSRPFTIGLQSSGRELVYDIQGTEDETVVQGLLAGSAPSSYLGLQLDSLQAEPIGGGIWKGYARYSRQEVEYTFDIGGGTQHITQGFGTIASYAPGGFTPPDFQGAIGVSEDRVEGADIPGPKYDFSETHIFSAATVTDAYKDSLLALSQGCFNNATFRGRDAGEVLFLGATGTNRGSGQTPITFRFSVSPNRTGMSIADITGIDKLGWDYLWVRYADFEDGTAFHLVKRPIAVYVERVFTPADFSVLLI